MAPTKRARPAFSPPRPRKTKDTTIAKASSSTGKTSKPINKSNTSKTPKSANGASKSKSKTGTTAPKRSRLVSPTPSNSDSMGGNSEDENSINDEDDDNDDNSMNSMSRVIQDDKDSPEPDYILAEITHESTTSTEPPIPLDLIHRILHSQFAQPEKTKISADAKLVVGKYIEVFAREAIMRCAYEKNDNPGSGVDASLEKSGWLELDDLEKVAVQLCLDF